MSGRRLVKRTFLADLLLYQSFNLKLVLQALFTRLISTAEAARLVVAAFIPFGAWMVAGMLRRPRPVPVAQKDMP